MIHDPQHTITTLTVRPPFGLSVIFADGETFHVDLGPMIKAHPSMHLLCDASLFN